MTFHLEHLGNKMQTKVLIKKLLHKTYKYILVRPWLRVMIVSASRKVGLYSAVKRLRNKLIKGVIVQNYMTMPKPSTGDISPRAQQIYIQLQAAIEHQREVGG